MVHCPKCGASLSPQVRFCDKCGQEQPATSWQQAAVTQSGLSENAAACLSYSLGWITGIIFFFVDRRPYVRFHAAQSMVVFIGLHVIRSLIAHLFGLGWFMGGFTGMHHWGAFGPGIALVALCSFIGFVLWIVCMIKAFQGERFMVPYAGEIAANLAAR